MKVFLICFDKRVVLYVIYHVIQPVIGLDGDIQAYTGTRQGQENH
jgi:hypothetical protein